ncbi:MAG TPA: DMT family transporter [Alphaproteobacteria bacterium]|jgi:drug/metabolite transporter (DMT)-like permease
MHAGSATRTTGALLVAGAALFWSSGGVIFRSIRGAEDWTIAFWRAVFMSAALVAVLAVTERGRVVSAFMRSGWRGLASGACFGIMMTGYMLALARTSVANTMMLMAAAPLFAALLGWAVLAERPRRAVWLAMAAAAAGIALMVASDLGRGAMLGNLLALMIAFAAAINIVVLRGAREINMIPAIVIGGVISGLVTLPLADHVGARGLNLALIFLLGVVQLGAGAVLYIRGARHLPAAETTLVALLESVLAPIWVWLLLGETPTAYGLAGGAIVLGAVVALTLSSARRRNGVARAPHPAG